MNARDIARRFERRGVAPMRGMARIMTGPGVEADAQGSLYAAAKSPQNGSTWQGCIQAPPESQRSDVGDMLVLYALAGNAVDGMARQMARAACREYPTAEPDAIAGALLLAALMVYGIQREPAGPAVEVNDA